MGWPFKREGPACLCEQRRAKLTGKKARMAESRSLPAGFGELEVLAVGTVLMVEGEPGRTWGGAGTQWATAANLEKRGPQILLLCAWTCGIQSAG